jgi:hypothetical protein
LGCLDEGADLLGGKNLIDKVTVKVWRQRAFMTPKMNAKPKLKSLFPWQGEIREGQKSGRTHPYSGFSLIKERGFYESNIRFCAILWVEGDFAYGK